MSRVDRVTARYHLDRRLRILRDSDAFPSSPRGWIKAIREALGMTSVTTQFELTIRGVVVFRWHDGNAIDVTIEDYH